MTEERHFVERHVLDSDAAVVGPDIDDLVDLFPVADIAGKRQRSFGVTDANARSIRAAGVAREKYDIGAMLHKDFGKGLQRLRKQQGISRRELADLFGIGGKKPARIIKYNMPGLRVS